MHEYLTSRNRRSENVRVPPVVIAELELRDVQRHVFAADFVEAADDAALEDRPEAFNRIGVDCSDDILPSGMVYCAVLEAGQGLVDLALVGREQADLVRDNLTDEALRGFLGDVSEDAGHHSSLAADRADNRSLGRWRVFASPAALADVLVLILPADESLIDLDNAAELFHIALDQCDADTVAHVPSGFVGAEAHRAHDLQRAHSLLAGEHHVSDAIPVPEGLVGVLEYGSGNDRKPITLRRTGPALPVERLVGRGVVQLDIATTGAMDALRPSAGHQIGFTGFLVGKHRLELGDGQLMNGLGAAGHDGSPSCGRILP